MIKVQGNIVGLKDNFDEQVQRLLIMCQDDDMANQRNEIMMKFAYQGPGRVRPRTLELRDRIEAAANAMGMDYTLLQDPESSFRIPVFVFIAVAPAQVLLRFYQAIGDH